MLQISDFFTEVKVAKSSDIARKYASEHHNVYIYANRSEKIRPFTVLKAPTDIILTGTFILVYFVSFR